MDSSHPLPVQIHLERQVLNLIKRRDPPLALAEFKWLLHHLFENFQSVQLEPLSQGKSGASVFLAWPIDKNGIREVCRVVKIGIARHLRKEAQNFETFVRGKFTFQLDLHPRPCRSPTGFAAIAYTFVGNREEEISTLANIVQRATGEPNDASRNELRRLIGETIIKDLFERCLCRWYEKSTPSRINVFDRDGYTLGRGDFTRLHDLVGQRKSNLPGAAEVQYLRHKWIELKSVGKLNTSSTVVHGDLHGGNVIFNKNTKQVSLIDFGLTGIGHFLKDFVKLEMDLKRLFIHTQPAGARRDAARDFLKIDSRLSNILTSRPSDEAYRDCTVVPKWFVDLIIAVRSFASIRAKEQDRSVEYVVGLVRYAVRMALYDSDQTSNDSADSERAALLQLACGLLRGLSISQGKIKWSSTEVTEVGELPLRSQRSHAGEGGYLEQSLGKLWTLVERQQRLRDRLQDFSSWLDTHCVSGEDNKQILEVEVMRTHPRLCEYLNQRFVRKGIHVGNSDAKLMRWRLSKTRELTIPVCFVPGSESAELGELSERFVRTKRDGTESKYVKLRRRLGGNIVNRRLFCAQSLVAESGVVRINGALSYYIASLADQDALEWELLSEAAGRVNKKGELTDDAFEALDDSLKQRGDAEKGANSDLATASQRSCAIAMSTLVVYRDAKDGKYRTIIGARSNIHAAHPGLYHVVPSGMFWRKSEIGRPRDEWDVRQRVLGEFGEELFSLKQGSSKTADLICRDQQWDCVAELNDKIARGECAFRVTGLVVNALNLRPELCAVLIIKDGEWWLNWQGRICPCPEFRTISGENSRHGFLEFELETLEEHFLKFFGCKCGDWVPPGLAALRLGARAARIDLGLNGNGDSVPVE